MKYLIINADDFWYSEVFNESILELIKMNLISSTTAMVNHIDSKQNKQVDKILKLKKTHKVSLGLHLELNNTQYNQEITKQYNRFIEIFWDTPTHLDIHKPNWSNSEKNTLYNFCKRNNIKCRNLWQEIDWIITTSNEYLNWTRLSFEKIESMLKNLKENESYEILFHPGTYDKNCKSSLNKEREVDIEKIKKLNSKLEENMIKIISFSDLPIVGI
jgi:predicted glycoside hydrolase/deacetylase ChbG (UPF0249 family)